MVFSFWWFYPFEIATISIAIAPENTVIKLKV